MNNIRNKVIMDLNHLLRYREFLLNKRTPVPTGTVGKFCANFCSFCGDDCVCMNSAYKLLNKNNLMLCSKYCSENVFNDCICLQK